jgi:hypothetical protein
MSERIPPRDIPAKQKAYAFERSLGIQPAEACRRAGAKVENGLATKWEQKPGVQAWIAHYRALGQTEEMLAAKRARIEERLELASYGSIFDFVTIDPTSKNPVVDWAKVAGSPYGVIVSRFKIDRENGQLVDFEREDALQALTQLRDMNGFRAARRTELTGKGGGPVTTVDLTNASDEQIATLEALFGPLAGPVENDGRDQGGESTPGFVPSGEPDSGS